MSVSSLVGPAGEHYTMSQLLRRGFIAALAPVGVPLADIIVTDATGQRACAIQVKSRREIGSDNGWHMKQKHETVVEDSLFYVFVSFPNDQAKVPDAFIVPSRTVANVIRISHATWLSSPGRNGRIRKDGSFRRFLPDYSNLGLSDGFGPGWLEPFRDDWEQLRPVRLQLT